MPVTPTYPGVYIEEIPSGVRTITGVATSITAFIGRAIRGPVGEPTPIFNPGDFQRMFGGLGVDYPMSYAVRDFFLNGGGQAIIVRLYKRSGGDGYARATHETLSLKAASPGTWGDNLRLAVNVEGITEDVADRYRLEKGQLFNLILTDTGTGAKEQINNVTYQDSPRRVDRVLQQVSSLARVDGAVDPTAALPSATPVDTPVEFGGGADSEPLSAATDYASAVHKANKTGLYALDKADLFNLLCIPPDTREGDTNPDVYGAAMTYCKDRRAMLIVDPPVGWEANKDTAASAAKDGLSALNLNGENARNTALYFPRVIQADPLREGQLDTFVPCGIIAGVMSRTDVTRGVWKAPAGLDAAINGSRGLSVNLTNDENGLLNPLGINCLRVFPITGRVVWGARTLRGADQLADEYKYVPVRRLALYIEESLFRGTQWVVFEPNDEPLWAQIRLNVGAFMHNLFRQGAFQGKSPREAYFVKCDKETTTQHDINLGIVNIVVGFAPLKPAEFVIIKIQQIAGQIEA
ncbi:MAG: phage tail sheath C-terminal domain-containing protein [Chloroflexota bacterium]